VLQRKDLYDLSDPVSPLARVEERQIMLDLLDVQPHHRVVDIPAWAGYLAEGITNIADGKQIMCVEPSPRFAAGIDPKFDARCTSQMTIPASDASIDRLGSMVGMHHLPDKLAFVRECARVVKPNGRIALSEVVEDSLVAKFLNGPVDRYTSNGHKGAFVKPGEMRDLLLEAGCAHVLEQFHKLFWRFTTLEECARFARGLLGLSKATEQQTIEAIQAHFELDITLNVDMEIIEVKWPWALAYAVGVRA
jgi:SAM-dependent methyltransferase